MKPLETPHILVSRCDRLGDLVLSLPALGHLRRAQLAEVPQESSPKLWLHCSAYARAVGEWALENRLCTTLWVEGDPLPPELSSAPICALSLFHCEATAKAFRRLPLQWSLGPRSKLSALWTYTHTVSQKRSRVEKSEMAYNVDLANLFLARMGWAPLKFEGLPALRLPASWRSPIEGADVLIVASNGGSAKNWPMESYLDFASKCLSEGRSVQFLIHGYDADLRREIWARSSLASSTQCLPSFEGLEQLVAHIGSCGEVVSSSTGPLHIAHALGRPVTGIYPLHPKVQSFERWRPDGFWHAAAVKWISIS